MLYTRLWFVIRRTRQSRGNHEAKTNQFHSINPSIYKLSRTSTRAMVAPAFGWSAGDLAVSITIIIKISEAFKKAGGASSQFAETTAFLDAFEATLQRIKDYTNDDANAKYTQSIVEQVKLIDGPYSKFEKYMQDFCPALGETSTQSTVRKAPRKIRWALKELSEVSGEIAKLKKAITDPMLFIGPLLLLQTL